MKKNIFLSFLNSLLSFPCRLEPRTKYWNHAFAGIITRILKATITMAMMAVCLCVFASTSAASSNLAPDNIRHKLETTRRDLQQVHTKLSSKKQQTKSLMQELQKAEEEISMISKDLYNLSTILQQEQTLYLDLQAKFITANEKYKTNQEILTNQIKLTYSMGNMPQLKLLFGNYEPNYVNRILTYYGAIYAHQQQKLQASIAILKEIQELRTAIQQKIVAINITKTKKSAEITKLKTSKSVRTSLLVDLNKSITQDNKTLALLQKDEKLLETKIKQLHRKTFRTKPNNDISSQTIFNQMAPHQPIISKSTKTKIRNISATNANRFLIQADPGSKVYAVQDGKVIFSSWLRGYGLLLIIEHNNDLMSLYGHTETLFKKVGDKVYKGEVIALVGQSGGQMLPGLYFEIRKAAKSINLKNWFDYETI